MAVPPAHTGYAFPGLANLHRDIYPNIDASKNQSLSQPGKVVLITGAGRGIGRSIALQYAAASVACIILCARTGSELDALESSIEEISTAVRVIKMQLDVTSEEAVKSCLEKVKAKEGRLDVLINNAGVSDDWVPIPQTKPTEWWKTLEVNLKGPYLFLQAFLPLMTETAKTSGTTADVVNITSIGANVVHPGASAYQISKLAVVRLTEFVQAEYGGEGINAIAVHPGGVLTELANGILALIDTPELCGGFVVWLTKGGRTWLGGRYVSATWDVDKLEQMRYEIVQEDKLKPRMVV
ncbi:putative oxidoreductase ucpA [Zopfia rhizophila CBS 207.26]|uniref:Putative oxidoreductase ucpA n=1 Tax=Zopfia rhizophila CBS 207.26 TaxID=1314779 RepID=A0A6A6DI87_9PEZI|nr:putative oxidoreductase ucpA [Zopfia rhizophila CBS 207.26]